MAKVGADEFGYMLADILKQNNVETSGVKFDLNARNALAFVTLSADREHEFLFSLNPSANMLLQESDLDENLIKSLIDEPCKSAHLTALKIAKEFGCILSYDPDLRLVLWPSGKAARICPWPLPLNSVVASITSTTGLCRSSINATTNICHYVEDQEVGIGYKGGEKVVLDHEKYMREEKKLLGFFDSVVYNVLDGKVCTTVAFLLALVKMTPKLDIVVLQGVPLEQCKKNDDDEEEQDEAIFASGKMGWSTEEEKEIIKTSKGEIYASSVVVVSDDLLMIGHALSMLEAVVTIT
ncbi:hypothetical protein VNO78_00462 [Psophocarpus tetragonolobus]|uniref:Carbohydrate kinase PfkB domain-containing protein n=1 Tax=Psophocarpus tetragonolobus TaxID=3891 RepID=A0AAN9SYG9_PSOTE